MMNTYKTAEIAKIIGIHPNTVRLYEKLELIPKPERLANGYKVYTDEDIKRLKIYKPSTLPPIFLLVVFFLSKKGGGTGNL